MEEIDLSDTEPNQFNSKRKQNNDEGHDSDRGADFDEISNDIGGGSDNEGMPNLENRINMVGRNE